MVTFKSPLNLSGSRFFYIGNVVVDRYIPVGILERVPQRINEKPPHYFGRSDLETLMASANCADWIKIRFGLDFLLVLSYQHNKFNCLVILVL